MYQPRQQIGRTSSTFMPSYANEGRNIPTPGLSFYPILPLSMEREIKLAGDKRRANEKAVAALKKRGNRRFVGGMAQGIADANPELAIQYPENLSSNPNEINRREILDKAQKIAREIKNPGLTRDERKNLLRILDLNRFYLSEQFPDVKKYQSSIQFFKMYDLTEDWKDAKVTGFTERVYANKQGNKGLLWRIRAGEESSVDKGILDSDTWDTDIKKIKKASNKDAEKREKLRNQMEEQLEYQTMEEQQEEMAERIAEKKRTEDPVTHAFRQARRLRDFMTTEAKEKEQQDKRDRVEANKRDRDARGLNYVANVQGPEVPSAYPQIQINQLSKGLADIVEIEKELIRQEQRRILPENIWRPAFDENPYLAPTEEIKDDLEDFDTQPPFLDVKFYPELNVKKKLTEIQAKHFNYIKSRDEEEARARRSWHIPFKSIKRSKKEV